MRGQSKKSVKIDDEDILIQLCETLVALEHVSV